MKKMICGHQRSTGMELPRLWEIPYPMWWSWLQIPAMHGMGMVCEADTHVIPGCAVTGWNGTWSCVHSETRHFQTCNRGTPIIKHRACWLHWNITSVICIDPGLTHAATRCRHSYQEQMFISWYHQYMRQKYSQNIPDRNFHAQFTYQCVVYMYSGVLHVCVSVSFDVST